MTQQCRESPIGNKTQEQIVDTSVNSATETAVIGGGCFWCLEAVYQQLKGVLQVESGYTGGHVKQPTYEQVCNGDTGHAEVIKLTFDPLQLSFREILEVFFTIHDPTTLNRQGNDVGTQYRSVIYYQSTQQQDTAKHIIAEMALVWDAPVVTELSPAETYYKAEDYHQNYFQQHPFQGYCAFVVAPKLSKFREVFAEKSKDE
jgi:peptide-methionine (S)-S-oxide reductase